MSDIAALCREAIQSATQLGNNAILTATERREIAQRTERMQQQQHAEDSVRKYEEQKSNNRVNWTRSLLWWSNARCSPIYPRKVRIIGQMEMFSKIPETIKSSQRTQKTEELAKLMDAQPATCGTPLQFSAIQAFLSDLEME